MDHPFDRRARRRALHALAACGAMLPLLAAPRARAMGPAAVAAATANAAPAGEPRIALPAAAFDLGYDGYLEMGGTPLRIAQASVEFRPEGEAYRMSMHVSSPLATLDYESRGTIDARGLHPREYREARKTPGRSPRERSVRFEESAGATRSAPAADGVLAVPPGTQDRLSLLMQLSLIARADSSRIAPGTRLAIDVAGLEYVTRARLEIGAPEPVRIGSGSIDAQRIHRLPDDPNATDIDFWLAAGPRRAPVVIRFADDGRGLRFVAQSA